MYKVEGTDFLRDPNNMSLINNNIGELEQYKLKRKLLKQQREEMDDIKSEISIVKEDVEQIKQLLLQILEKYR